MDRSVIRTMARWPKVPAVYGWMSLDCRGCWRLQGQPVVHHGAIAFMNRNYACNTDGQWYFQNGPQRVFVDLDYTPWIYSLDGAGFLVDHVEEPVKELRGAWLDQEGNLLLLGERGIGLLCDRDLGSMSDHLRHSDGRACDAHSIEGLIHASGGAKSRRICLVWKNKSIDVKLLPRGQVAGEFGFDPRPRARDRGG